MGRQPKTDEPVFNKIAHIRKRHGLSRRDLADQAGVHYQTIGYLERGEYAPSLHLALKLSELLDCSVSSIFSLQPLESNGDSTSPH